MREGIVISALLHVIAITVALTGLPFLETTRPVIDEIIPVDIIDVAKLSAAPEPKQLETSIKPEAVKPKPRRRVEAPPPANLVPPPGAPVARDVAKPRVKPKPPRKRRTASLAPRAKPKPPKRYDRSRISALLDKRREDKEKPAKTAKPPAHQATKDLKIRSRLASIDAERLTASLRDSMRAQIERCWIVPAGARDAEDLTITIRVFLNPDGSLARPPEIVDARRMFRKGQEFYRVAAEGARRAVQKCAPLDLPVEHYDIWRTAELTFDPSKMLGG